MLSIFPRERLKNSFIGVMSMVPFRPVTGQSPGRFQSPSGVYISVANPQAVQSRTVFFFHPQSASPLYSFCAPWSFFKLLFSRRVSYHHQKLNLWCRRLRSHTLSKHAPGHLWLFSLPTLKTSTPRVPLCVCKSWSGCVHTFLDTSNSQYQTRMGRIIILFLTTDYNDNFQLYYYLSCDLLRGGGSGIIYSAGMRVANVTPAWAVCSWRLRAEMWKERLEVLQEWVLEITDRRGSVTFCSLSESIRCWKEF